MQEAVGAGDRVRAQRSSRADNYRDEVKREGTLMDECIAGGMSLGM